MTNNKYPPRAILINCVRDSDVDKIDKKLEYLRSRMRKGIESACQDENKKFVLSVMLDDLVCTAVSLGIVTATMGLNNRNKKEEIDSKDEQRSI